MVARKPITKESTKEAVKTIRVRECRVIPVVLAVANSCGFCFSHARLRVRTGTRHSPRPLLSRGFQVFGTVRAGFASRKMRACVLKWLFEDWSGGSAVFTSPLVGEVGDEAQRSLRVRG